MKLTSEQKTRIEKSVRFAINRAKNDRTTYERNLLSTMDWQNDPESKAKDAKEVFRYDEESTESIISDLMMYIEGDLDR